MVGVGAARTTGTDVAGIGSGKPAGPKTAEWFDSCGDAATGGGAAGAGTCLGGCT